MNTLETIRQAAVERVLSALLEAGINDKIFRRALLSKPMLPRDGDVGREAERLLRQLLSRSSRD